MKQQDIGQDQSVVQQVLYIVASQFRESIIGRGKDGPLITTQVVVQPCHLQRGTEGGWGYSYRKITGERVMNVQRVEEAASKLQQHFYTLTKPLGATGHIGNGRRAVLRLCGGQQSQRYEKKRLDHRSDISQKVDVIFQLLL